MRYRAPFAVLVAAVVTSCAGGGPATLGYVVPAPSEATYVVGDTLLIALQGLGQEMEIGARSRATYDLVYAAGAAGPRGR